MTSNDETTPSKVYMVTGANVGLGLETARQLALKEDTKKVYLACRTESKALAAIDSLAVDCGIPKEKLAFVPFDCSATKDTISTDTIKALPSDEKLDGLVFNAGGPGHDAVGNLVGPNKNILESFQVNLIGHIHLLELLKSNNFLKLDQHTTIIFAGSENARGIPTLSIPMPTYPTDLDGYKARLDGTAYTKFDAMDVYGDVKGIGALYWAAWARENPEYFVMTVSPGATKGTAVGSQKGIPLAGRLLMPLVFFIGEKLGVCHALETGAKRFVDAVTREGEFKEIPNGGFVASVSEKGATGPVGDQSKHPRGAIFADTAAQDLAHQAVNSVL